jgi:transposase
VERLHMNRVHDLIRRLRCGQSERRISDDLGLSRVTVRKYRVLAQGRGYLDPTSPLPDGVTLAAVLGPARVRPRVASTLEPFRPTVSDFLDMGLEMAAIFARLRDDFGYTGSYSSVRRFVHRLRPNPPRVVVRVETGPGEQAQVDFGPVGKLYDPESDRVRPAYAFVMTLSFSRHQYAELVFDQKVSTWIGLHRRAFESLGGVPRRIVPDNLKAAVLRASLHDCVLGEAYRCLALHYDFLVSPTRPHTPRHKGKVESGIHYLQRNFMAGQQFADIHQANQRLRVWVRERAGTRDHGTTHQPPFLQFTQYERGALLPLPKDPFTLCEIKPVKVHPDCHVTIDGSYYSVPYPHVGHTLDAYVGERVVELFADHALVATHVRAMRRGQRLTRTEHYPPHKAAYLERVPARCLELAQAIGPATHGIVQTLLSDRPLDRLRQVQSILKLEESVGARRLEAACARAQYFGGVSYRRIKEILNAALDREPLPDDIAPPPPRAFTFARSAREFFAAQLQEAAR